MSVLCHEVRAGAYYDSIVLMRLQAGLAAEEGVEDCGAVMATDANLVLLAASDLRPETLPAIAAEDLLIVVRAETNRAGTAALGRIDALLTQRRGGDDEDDYRPRSLATGLRQAPEAPWVTVSVPGRYAADVASEALDAERNVFLYSDNVTLGDELALKQRARACGRLVMGPDCGTAIIGGVGLGFANRVTAGPVGLIAASGTGLQTVATALARNGIGISQAIGTGGRDLSDAIGGITTRQALAVLGADPATELVVLISKPPSPSVAREVLAAASAIGKPIVVCFLGLTPPVPTVGRLHFVVGLEAAAERARALLAAPAAEWTVAGPAGDVGWLRGLFAGGTLAYEALLQLRLFASPLFSNTPVDGVSRLPDPVHSEGHTILDMGADEYTVGRLHPMIDPDLRLRRLRHEAADPAVGTLLLDVVLGDGAEADPAARLAPVIADIRDARPALAIHVMVLGTDDDPQEPAGQCAALAAAGAIVHRAPSDALTAVSARLLAGTTVEPEPSVVLSAFASPPAAINVGLSDFGDAMRRQGAAVVNLDWRPPAGGDERLIAILKRMKGPVT